MPLKKPRNIDSYNDPYLFEEDGMSHWVYTKGEGPAVLVMHELPGLTPACRELCDTIAGAGYTVYLPLMFGEPEVFSVVGNLARVCISKQFRLFAKNEGSPIIGYLRALGRKAHAECGGKGIGVIGMCLTGNFSLSLFADDHVLAPIMAQPSMPFVGMDELHINDQDLAAAKAHAAEMGPSSILGFRYKGDPMCRAAKFERLQAELGDHFEGHAYPGNAHSTLTDDQQEHALERTLAFFKEKLVA